MLRHKLEPMTPEKEQLLKRAASEWNRAFFLARKYRIRPTQWRSRDRLISRPWKTSKAFIRHAVTCASNSSRPYIGLYTFPISPHFVTIAGGLVLLRIFPYLDLAFYWPYKQPPLRISRYNGDWYGEYEE